MGRHYDVVGCFDYCGMQQGLVCAIAEVDENWVCFFEIARELPEFDVIFIRKKQVNNSSIKVV